MNSDKVKLSVIEAIMAEYSKAVLHNDTDMKTCICHIKGRLVRISIMKKYKAVVFSNPQTEEKIVKLYY